MIEIEKTFDAFVEAADLGRRVDKFKTVPDGHLNADYFFSETNVIAELKTLEADPRSADVLGERLLSAFLKCGHTGSDLFGYLFRGARMPAEVQQKLIETETRCVFKAIEKANKQIRSTKRFLARPGAKGLILIANDNNFGLTPRQAVEVMCKAFRRFEGKECHTDAIVYFTPNVYYDDGTNIARSVWIPLYNIGSEGLSDFVNVLGRRWGDFNDRSDDPYLERRARNEIPPELLAASPIEVFKRK